MTHDPRMPRAASLDDDAIGLLVRELAHGWTMPPVRLDAPGWRDRVRGRRARLAEVVRRAFDRAGRAAMAAIALTVVAALVAVVITRPPQQPAGTPNPTGGATAEPTAGAATPLPKLVLNGDVPFPTRILVENDAGDIALVDLASGTIGASFARTQWPSAMSVTATGLVVCVCITTAAPVDGYPTQFDVRLRTFTRATTPVRDDPVDVLVGKPDPRVPPTRADHVWTSISFSPDDRYAFIGWSTRDAPVWHGGVIVVDIAAGAVTGRPAFPDMTTGEGDARRTVGAPRVLGQAADGTILLARSWAEWGSANVDTEPIRVGDDAYQARVVDGSLADLVPVPEAATCSGSFVRAGSRPGGGIWVTCAGPSGGLTLRRVAGDGTSLGAESMTRTGFIDGDTTAVSADGRIFYAWDPGTSTLTRIDLESGDRVDRQLKVASASVDPMTAFGRWLAPTAAAKSILRGAILVSPDGTRLYVLAVQPGADERAPGGSAGVLVVDAGTLQVVDHWPPAADLMSISLNAGGTLLYAAGLPGVDASGSPSPAQGASVTVYDTATGVQRLVAGQLGTGMLSFPGPVVP